jgi:hypothetical protein
VTFLQDMKSAARMLAKNPGFVWIAILTRTWGWEQIPSFSVVNGVILNRLPFANPLAALKYE